MNQGVFSKDTTFRNWGGVWFFGKKRREDARSCRKDEKTNRERNALGEESKNFLSQSRSIFQRMLG
jgi:hypothetical protein